MRAVGLRPHPVKVHPVLPDKTENPLGLRDRLNQIPKSPDLLRIAFLGDSFTFGLGVEREQTFSYQVGLLLRQHYSGKSMTINLGRDGADLIGEWSIYNRVRDSIEAQVLVHVISQNDLDFDLYRSFDPIGKLVTDRMWPSRFSRLFEYTEAGIRLWIGNKRSLDYMRGGDSPEMRERSWRIAALELTATQRLAREVGAVYAIVRFPWLRTVAGPYPLMETHRRTAEAAERIGAPYLDLLEAFRGRPAADMCLLPYDDHPTPAAHRIAAEAICTFLVRQVIPRAHLVAATKPTKARTREEIDRAEAEHYEQILKIDPNCFSARFHLDRIPTSRKAP